MSKIISIGTAVPSYKHSQSEILSFMQNVFAMDEKDKRKLKFLYGQSGIDTRYSVIADYSRNISDWKFFSPTENLEPFPVLEERMAMFNKYAPQLSIDAIRKCINGHIAAKDITHLITVSCTGMSAPGLDLQIMELLDLPKNIYRTSINFMGCYAAIHALKIADSICSSSKDPKVLIVCTELCTLHFQKEPTQDVIAASLLFGDGAAAVLVQNDDADDGLHITGFYSEVITKGKRDMSWELSSSGFLMTLSGYIPELIEEDFRSLVDKALIANNVQQSDIGHWCIHPGGKRILQAIQRCLSLQDDSLLPSYDVLRRYGNMSSPTILFVLKEMMNSEMKGSVFGAAFGPGLTMETFVASAHA